MTKLSQPPVTKRSKVDEDKDRYSREALRLLEQLGAIVVKPGDPLELGKSPQRAAVFWPGDHGVVTVDLAGAQLLLMPGARLQRLVVSADCMVSGGEIRQQSTAPTTLVVVTGTARLVMSGVRVKSDAAGASLVSVGASACLMATGCWFHKSTAGVFVSVAAGGKLISVGANYGPATTMATKVIDNAGVAGDACTMGNNDTPVGHTNTTVIFES